MKPESKKINHPKSKGITKKTDTVKSTKKLTATLKENKTALQGILKKSSDETKKTKKHKSKEPKSENAFTNVDDSEMPDSHKGNSHKVKGERLDKKNKQEKRVYTKKERRESRLKSKKHGDIVPELLTNWEILRREDTPKERKKELIEKMLALGKDKLVDLSRARDTSRIIESMVQFGTEVQRWAVFAEFKDRLRFLCMSQYAKFVILKLITYGAKEHRLEFFKAFRGYVVKLLRHKQAAEVLELLYNDYATASQRAMMLQEAYGQQFALQLTANNVQRLEQAIELNPDKKLTILANLNNLLVAMVTKGLLRLSIVQHLLLEYLTELLKSPDMLQLQISAKVTTKSTKLVLGENEETEETKDADDDDDGEEGTRRGDRLETLVEAILEAQVISMLHTREGVRAALAVLWICPPKDRKTLIKSMKTVVVSLAYNEHGHLFLMGLLDAVDDTKLVAKTIIKELLEDLDEVVSHPHARKVLLYALTPRDPRHFPAQFIQSIIAPGDESPFTRKPLAIRALELRTPLMGLLPALLTMASDRLVEMFVGDAGVHHVPLEDRSRLVLLAEILSTSSADKLELSTAQAQFKRSGQREVDRCKGGLTSPLSIADFSELFIMRQAALTKLVEVCLVPEFIPTGLPNQKPRAIGVGQIGAETKRHLQEERRKRALAVAENESIKKRKVTVKAFTNVDDDDVVKAEELDANVPMDVAADDAPFLERPEGQLLIKRLLLEEKKTGAHELGRLIMELVPEDNLTSWLTCNRSCFTLVNLYELEDPDINKRLIEILSGSKQLINASTLPGAKILAKHLAVAI